MADRVIRRLCTLGPFLPESDLAQTLKRSLAQGSLVTLRSLVLITSDGPRS